MKSLELKIPPPVYALSIALLMWLLSQYAPGVQLGVAGNKAGLAIIIIAGTFDLWSLFLFFKKKTTVNPLSPKNTTDLVITGLYRISRNPMYVGMLLMLLGYAVWLGSLTSFLVVPLFYFLITKMQIKPEEVILEKNFGQEYLNYKNSVRRWL